MQDRAAARAATRATVLMRTHDTGARRTRPSLEGLVSRRTFWCHYMVGLHGVATYCWCSDTKAARRAILVSRHDFWCRNMC